MGHNGQQTFAEADGGIILIHLRRGIFIPQHPDKGIRVVKLYVVPAGPGKSKGIGQRQHDLFRADHRAGGPVVHQHGAGGIAVLDENKIAVGFFPDVHLTPPVVRPDQGGHGPAFSVHLNLIPGLQRVDL